MTITVTNFTMVTLVTKFINVPVAVMVNFAT
jgi:hypothetical protein